MVEIRLSRAGASQRVESAVRLGKQLMTPDFDARRGGAQSSADRLDGIIPACRSQLDVQPISSHTHTDRQTDRLQVT